MRRGVEARLRWLLLLSLLVSCAGPQAAASSGVTPAPAGANEGAASSADCPRPRRPSRFREMTWSEYYADVRERAWRNNAAVIWITPPKVKKPRSGLTNGETATACAR